MRTLLLFVSSMLLGAGGAYAKTSDPSSAAIPLAAAITTYTGTAEAFPWPWRRADRPGRASRTARRAQRRTRRVTHRSALLTRLSLTNHKRKANRVGRKGRQGKPKRFRAKWAPAAKPSY